MVELRPDAVIGGKLRLLRPLGQGGMGVVWAARHLRLDIDVAVKLIRPERVAADPTLFARFEREARAVARIAHPHVVQVMDYGAVDEVPYIVMELLRGFSLADLLDRGGRFSFATARSLVDQMGSALEAAHAHGIVHRDIKPHNVFITEGSAGYPLFVKVLDFGVAKLSGDAQIPGASRAITETGMVIGSPPYMSPEQLEGRKDVDQRSDLWSLGVIVYECLTGRLPFVGSSFVAVGAAVLKGTYRSASELRPDLSASLDDWFAKALCLDPDGRFQSAAEMVAAFARRDSSPIDVPEPAPERARDVAHQTTIAAAPSSDTVPHDRVALRPARSEAPRLRWRSFLLLAVGLGAALALGLARAMQPAGSAQCPPGMTLIEGGRFAMGSPEDAETPTDEMPLHDESVERFCLDTTEVTVRAYAACASCQPAPRTVAFEGLTHKAQSFERQFCNGDGEADHPINCIDWFQANTYCEAQGKRLPTEQEWELAARGAGGRLYPWGNEPPTDALLNGCDAECSAMLTERRAAVGKGAWPAMHQGSDTAPSTAPAGSYPEGASPAGVLDMAGNVWEWTDSAYCPYGGSDCSDSRRVLRGGGWDSTEPSDVRAARRYPSAPNARGRSIGFRCAKAP